jgi:hypothetical protein
VERGVGVNILEDARHSSVLYLYRILFDPDPFQIQKHVFSVQSLKNGQMNKKFGLGDAPAAA